MRLPGLWTRGHAGIWLQREAEAPAPKDQWALKMSMEGASGTTEEAAEEGQDQDKVLGEHHRGFGEEAWCLDLRPAMSANRQVSGAQFWDKAPQVVITRQVRGPIPSSSAPKSLLITSLLTGVSGLDSVFLSCSPDGF